MTRWPTHLVLLALLVTGCPREEKPAPAPIRDTPARIKALLKKMPHTKPAPGLSAKLATRLVRLSLDCADREYPNKPGQVLTSDEEAVPPRKLHPAFYGCFDWHSAVHGHWTMVRILRMLPDLELGGTIRKILDRHLDPEAIAGEVSYFEAEHHKLFERPYGWGWLLRLAAELHDWQEDDPDARRWAAALEPLERLLVRRTIDYLDRLSLPVRAGTHHSTAFALAHIHDYAVTRRDGTLREAVEAASRRFYLADRSCPTSYEPSGEDFISPCLAEADLMRRVLPPAPYAAWLTRFLPPLTSPEFEPLLRPPEVRDRKDPKIGHLIGLSLQRAWTMKGIAEALPDDDPRRQLLQRMADTHRDEGLRLMFDSGYGGAHWLASFAVFLLSDANTVRPRPEVRDVTEP